MRISAVRVLAGRFVHNLLKPEAMDASTSLGKYLLLDLIQVATLIQTLHSVDSFGGMARVRTQQEGLERFLFVVHQSPNRPPSSSSAPGSSGSSATLAARNTDLLSSSFYMAACTSSET